MLEKILLAEVSDNTIWYDYFPYAQNVWLVKTDNIYTDFSHIDFNLESIGLESEITTISFQVRKEPYLRVDTISDVITIQKTFYYDIDTHTLLIHFENHKPYYYWQENELEIGFALGFYCAGTNKDLSGIWNNMQYYPRLKNIPVLEDIKDDIYFAKQILNGASIEIDNHDFEFKNFNSGPGIKKINGNYVRTLIWSGEDASNALYDDFEITFQGVIEKTEEGAVIKIFLRDLRSILKEVSPVRFLDTSSYPNIKDIDKDYILPELWGKCYSVPVQCLNENVNDGGGSTAYEFLICDITSHVIATNSIQAVYINKKLTSLSPIVTFNYAQAFAKFSIAASYFGVYNGSSTRYENMDKVSIDIYGYLKGVNFRESDGSITSYPTGLIENGMAIIRQIILNNYGWDYISALYDITTWKLFEDEAYDIGYFLNKQISTQKQIEELAQDQLGKFKWNENLKFTFDNDDFDEYKHDINKEKLSPIDFVPKISIDSTQVLASVKAGYKRRWDETDEEKKYIWTIDETNKETALLDYNSYLQKSFPTNINNLTDLQDYISRILIFGGISIDTVSILVNWEYRELKAGEWIKVQIDLINEEILGWTKCQIQSIKPKIDSWQVEIKLRIFDYLLHLLDNNGNYITNNDLKKILIPYSEVS